MTQYIARFSNDGSGNWSIQLADDCDQWDLHALGPVVAAIKDFATPSTAPCGYRPGRQAAPGQSDRGLLNA
jgi:hypothetical protein